VSTDVEVLDCYRVIRIRATPEQWERAIRGFASEVQAFVRRRLEQHARLQRRGEAGDCCTIALGESPYPHSPGRSIEYYAGMFRANGLDLKWQHHGKPYVVGPPQDGRSHQ
jgi:hypothetical protein